MQNFLNPGITQTFTAPAGGVVGGTPLLIGSLVVVPVATVAAGLPFEGMLDGVFTLPKAAGVAWTEGAALYFDSATNNFATAASLTARRAGTAVAAAIAGAVTGSVRLNNINAPVNFA